MWEHKQEDVTCGLRSLCWWRKPSVPSKERRSGGDNLYTEVTGSGSSPIFHLCRQADCNLSSSSWAHTQRGISKAPKYFPAHALILPFSSTCNCDTAGLTLACMCRICPVYRLLLGGVHGMCLSAGQPPMVLTPLWEVTSGTREGAAEIYVRAGSRSRLSQDDGREGNFDIFPKSLKPQGLVGHSCADSTITGGFNCDTSHDAPEKHRSHFPLPFPRAFYRAVLGAWAGRSVMGLL